MYRGGHPIKPASVKAEAQEAQGEARSGYWYKMSTWVSVLLPLIPRRRSHLAHLATRDEHLSVALFVNKQGQTWLAQYYEHLSLDERRALEGEIVRKCLARTD